LDELFPLDGNFASDDWKLFFRWTEALLLMNGNFSSIVWKFVAHVCWNSIFPYFE